MKNYIYLSVLLFGLTLSPFLTSCGGDEEETTPPAPPTPEQPLSPEEQKERMETIAINFANEFNADNFKEITNLVTYLSEEYSTDRYEYESIAKWGENCLEAITATFTGKSTEKEDWGYGNDYTAIYDNYTMLYMASNFTGNFVAKNGRWKYSESSNLSFTMQDENGEDCIVTLTTSGATKKIYVGDEHDWQTWDSFEDEDGWHYVKTYDRYNQYIMVPANINVTLHRAGVLFGNFTLKTDLSSMKSENFDLSKDSYTATATLAIDKYEISLNKVKYAPEKGSQIVYAIKHNNKELLSTTIDADIDATNEEFYGCDNVKININVLGSMQIKGNCTNAVKLNEYLDRAEDNYDNEQQFKDCIKKANNLLDLGLYYDNENTKYATVELKAFMEDYYYYPYNKWDYTPAIVFEEDGTSYTFEEFFNERDFRKLIRTIEDLIEDYTYMLGDTTK